MRQPLTSLTIRGFKSIRELNRFELSGLNVIVGANGAGKSNFVSFFRMLRALADEGLAAFVTRNGGADGFFFDGPKQTAVIEAIVNLKGCTYRIALAPTAAIRLMIQFESADAESAGSGSMASELTGSERAGSAEPAERRETASGELESRLRQWAREASEKNAADQAAKVLYESISSWRVYHFHDTSMTAGMRRDHPARDRLELDERADNIAPFLRYLKRQHAETYDSILDNTRLIAPFLDDFILEPERQGETEMVRLEWRQKGSAYPFQPWQLSDGTLRFICLATVLLQLNPPATIVIDEPELGLHPFALDALAGLIRDAAERTQVIISTQSATLLNHFEPEEVIVVDREGGASRFRRLDAAALREWLADYSLGELWHKNVFDGGPVYE